MSVFVDRLYPRESAEFIVANGTNNIQLSQEGILKVAQLVRLHNSSFVII